MIETIANQLDKSVILKLREQICEIFLGALNEETLIGHVLNEVINSQEAPLHHLRGRENIPYATNDIHEMGLSIFEKVIFTGLHKTF